MATPRCTDMDTCCASQAGGGALPGGWTKILKDPRPLPCCEKEAWGASLRLAYLTKTIEIVAVAGDLVWGPCWGVKCVAGAGAAWKEGRWWQQQGSACRATCSGLSCAAVGAALPCLEKTKIEAGMRRRREKGSCSGEGGGVGAGERGNAATKMLLRLAASVRSEED